MSEFNKLHEHLRECVDNDHLVCMTSDGVEFSLIEYALGLSVNAKREHDQLLRTIKEKDKVISELSDLVFSAFREGYAIGFNDGIKNNSCDPSQWEGSYSMRELSRIKQSKE